MTPYFILGMTYAFAAVAQPGPLQTYLVSRALSQGWRRTLPAALSPLVSDGPIILLVLLVLSRIPVRLAEGLRCAGGVLLLYLAFDAAKAWRSYDPGKSDPAPSGKQSLMRATVVNLLNPGPYLGWSLIMGPLFLRGWREAPAHGVALIAGFYGVMVPSLAGIIVLSATARGLGPRLNRALVGMSALALAGLGCWQLWSGLKTFR